MKVLILWSGGVESTSLLKQYLCDTQDEIFAHYILMDNPEKARIPLELAAIEILLPMLQRIRHFEYSTSRLSICNGKAFPNDIHVHAFIGVQAMYHKGCTQLLRAQCLEDDIIKTTVDGVHTVLDTYNGFETKQAKLKPFLKGSDTPESVYPIHPSYAWPKKQHIEYLGDLFQYTHSCRRPVNGKECGKCHSCIERNG